MLNEAVGSGDYPMKMNSADTWMIVGYGALVGTLLMAFFLVTGAWSPEPSDHPRWWNRLGGTLPGYLCYLIVLALCLPAIMFAGVVRDFLVTYLGVPHPLAMLYTITFVTQAALFGGGALGIAKLIGRLRS